MSGFHPGIPEHYRNEVVTGDARLLAEALPGNSAALAFADPPYWVGFDYGGMKDSDFDRIEPEWLVTELRRIAPVVCITPGIANLWDYPKADWVLGWFKPASNRRNGYGSFNTWEPILVYGDCPRDLWQDAISLHAIANAQKGQFFHACPKPVGLLAWLVEGITSPGEVVFDPVAGSGTSAVAAKATGRNFIAFEIDPATAERARERVRLTPLPLLLPEPEPHPSLFAEVPGC